MGRGSHRRGRAGRKRSTSRLIASPVRRVFVAGTCSAKAFAFFVVALTVFRVSALKASNKPETWIEVRSPHFTVVTDGGEKQGRDIATHFEQIRGVFQKALPHVRVDPTAPVVILATKNGKGLGELLPGFWNTKGERRPAGMFVGGPGINYVALRLDANREDDYHVVYHEYVHLLESLNFTSMPLWISEGLADFYGSVRPMGRTIGIGYPIYDYAYLLQNAFAGNGVKILPLSRVFTANEESPEYNKEDLTPVFYAESWALTDYLFTTKKASEKEELLQYMQAVEKGESSVDAARQAFGDLKQLQSNLERFAREARFHYYAMKAPFRAATADFSSRTLSNAEADAVRGDFLVETNRPKEAKPLLQEASRLDPDLSAPYESLGVLALRRGDEDQALHFLDRAIALNSTSFVAYYNRAELLLHGPGGLDTVGQAEADLNRCINLNSNFAEGYRALAAVESARGEDPAQALALARRAIELQPGSAENHMTAGTILLRMQETKQAETEARQALLAARNGEERTRARQFLDEVMQRETSLSVQNSALGPGLHISTQQIAPESPVGKRTEARPVASPGAVTSDMLIAAQGVARQVKCKGTELKLLLVVNGAGIPLRAGDFSTLKYEGQIAPAGFNPCTALQGRHITAHFSVMSGKILEGNLIEIDFTK